MKYVLVTGGVVSGLGKGVTASSVGVLLKACGHRVTHIKIDPYLNVDAGTMSPFEHGEVFVLDDGGEADLDLGNYERFVDITLTRDNNLTTGKAYASVIERERKGEYLGKTVQVVPHITDEIQDWIERVSHTPVDGSSRLPSVCVIELGGTVGDIESMPFLEALRQFQFRVGPKNMCVIHVSLVPVLGVVGEQKTKPTQHSVQVLRSLGLQPHLLACRSSTTLEAGVRDKLALFCQVPPDSVLGMHDVSNIWQVPPMLMEQKAHVTICNVLGLTGYSNIDMTVWKRDLANRWDSHNNIVTIAIIGKYTNLSDAYLSVIKALQHACLAMRHKLDLCWVEAGDIEAEAEDPSKYRQAWDSIRKASGVVIPGGFGKRGVEGMILAAKYCRENKKPYLGICLGMQVAVIEFARTVLEWEQAHSAEFSPECGKPVVIFMPEGSKTHMGGTMRLGCRATVLQTADCHAAKLYRPLDHTIHERHRHRYEVNPDVIKNLEAAGLRFVGKDDTGERMEIVELDVSDHPFFMGVQYHPEFKSRPLKPSPPFHGLIAAAVNNLEAAFASPGDSGRLPPVVRQLSGA
eukprot:jgi/Ulvmu1/9258/UM050_0007.1